MLIVGYLYGIKSEARLEKKINSARYMLLSLYEQKDRLMLLERPMLKHK